MSLQPSYLGLFAPNTAEQGLYFACKLLFGLSKYFTLRLPLKIGFEIYLWHFWWILVNSFFKYWTLVAAEDR